MIDLEEEKSVALESEPESSDIGMVDRVKARIELALNMSQIYMTTKGKFKDLKEFSADIIGK